MIGFIDGYFIDGYLRSGGLEEEDGRSAPREPVGGTWRWSASRHENELTLAVLVLLRQLVDFGLLGNNLLHQGSGRGGPPLVQRVMRILTDSGGGDPAGTGGHGGHKSAIYRYDLKSYLRGEAGGGETDADGSSHDVIVECKLECCLILQRLLDVQLHVQIGFALASLQHRWRQKRRDRDGMVEEALAQLDTLRC